MSEAFAEARFHQNVRSLRLELAGERMPLKQARLRTLIARAKMEAEDRDWSLSAD